MWTKARATAPSGCSLRTSLNTSTAPSVTPQVGPIDVDLCESIAPWSRADAQTNDTLSHSHWSVSHSNGCASHSNGSVSHSHWSVSHSNGCASHSNGSVSHSHWSVSHSNGCACRSNSCAFRRFSLTSSRFASVHHLLKRSSSDPFFAAAASAYGILRSRIDGARVGTGRHHLREEITFSASPAAEPSVPAPSIWAKEIRLAGISRASRGARARASRRRAPRPACSGRWDRAFAPLPYRGVGCRSPSARTRASTRRRAGR